MIPQSEWVWHGTAGHWCCADKCLFRLHTHVGQYCISTIGEYYPNGVDGEMKYISYSGYYETMVFDEEKDNYWSEIKLRRCAEREQAVKQHMELCKEYAQL